LLQIQAAIQFTLPFRISFPFSADPVEFQLTRTDTVGIQVNVVGGTGLGALLAHAQVKEEGAALAAVTELTPPFLVISEPANLLDSPALEKFSTVPQGVSFTDCLVMAVADEYATLDIFGFDKQFADAGYHRLEPSTEWKEAT